MNIMGKLTKELDDHAIHLIGVIVFTGSMILLEHIFSDSLQSFFYALLPTILMILFYVLLNLRASKFENNIKSIIEAHIPDTVYINNADSIKTQFVEAVKDADRYIMATGGRSSIQEYLMGIEDRIEKKDIEYYRILFGKRISRELHNHLSRIIGRHGVYISHTNRELSPTLLVTEKIAFIGLPEPEHHEFKTCLKIPDEEIIEKMGKYVRGWYAKTQRLSSVDDLNDIRSD